MTDIRNLSTTHTKSTSTLVNSRLPCPFCDSSDAFSEYDDGHGYCFSCEGYRPGKNENNFLDDTCSYQTLPHWGISERAFHFFGVTTKVDSTGKPVSVGFRHPNGDTHVRKLSRKEFYWVKSGSLEPHGLFGKDKFAEGSHEYVIVTEGAKDALSMWETVQVPCVSVVSASSAASDCTVDRPYLNSFKRIYICFDSDSPGRAATERVAKLFDADKVWEIKFSNRKDANEYLVAGEHQELRNIFWNSRRYIPESLLCTFSEFDKVLEEPVKLGIKYPFAGITNKTKGIRLGESVLITAQEGVGKTEMMHAIEYEILRNTNSNVGAIFLEELPRRHLQSLAGIYLKAPVHLPDSGYTNDQVRDAIRTILVEDERLFLYRNFGADDPEVLLDTIRYLVAGRNCDYILLDHITMVVSGNSQEDERRKLDYLSTKLEMMVKELNYALIVVSHVNDLGQTRGSRYISKIADVRIDAQRDLNASTDVGRRTIRLSISKNRPAWQTGDAGSYVFDPLTNSYTESEDVGYSFGQEALPYHSSPHVGEGEPVDAGSLVA